MNLFLPHTVANAVVRLTILLLIPYGLLTGVVQAQQPVVSVSPLPSEGDRLFQRGDFVGAANAYRHALGRHKTDSAALGLVRSLLRQDQWEQAIKEAEAFVHRSPAVADAHGILAFAYKRGGRFDEAAKEAQQALQLQKESYWGLVSQGWVQSWNEQNEAALTSFRMAAQLQPQEPDALDGLLGQNMSPEELVKYAEVYLQLSPQGYPYRTGIQYVQGMLPVWRSSEKVQAFGGGTLTLSGASETVTLPLIPLGTRYMLEAKLAAKTVRLLFDTGAANLTLYQPTADTLSLTPLTQSMTIGVRGLADITCYQSEKLQIGRLNLVGIPLSSTASAADQEPVDPNAPVSVTYNGPGKDPTVVNSQPMTSDEGILGANVFAPYRVAIDTHARTLTLIPGDQPYVPLPNTTPVEVPFHYVQQHIVVPCTLGGRPGWGMVDTGAVPVMISNRVAKQIGGRHMKRWTDANAIGGLGSSSKQITFLAADKVLEGAIGAAAFNYYPLMGASALDLTLSPAFTFEVDAVLGMPALLPFRRVLIDYPHRKLILETSLYRDPNQQPQPFAGGAWLWLSDHWEWGAYGSTVQERGQTITFPADPNAQRKP